MTHNQTLEWTDEGTWLNIGSSISNTWLWGATQVMPLFSGQLLNYTLGLRLPPMELLLTQGESPLMAKDTWELVISDPKATRVVENKELERQGYVVPKAKADSVSTIKCFRNMVLIGEKPFLIGCVRVHLTWKIWTVIGAFG
jgi:hypothetical protein